MSGKLTGIIINFDQLPSLNPMDLLPLRFVEGEEPEIKDQEGNCDLFVGVHQEKDGIEFIKFTLINYETGKTDSRLSPVHPNFSHAYLRDQAAIMAEQETPLLHQGLQATESAQKLQELLSPWFEMNELDCVSVSARIQVGVSLRYGHVPEPRLDVLQGIFGIKIKGPNEP